MDPTKQPDAEYDTADSQEEKKVGALLVRSSMTTRITPQTMIENINAEGDREAAALIAAYMTTGRELKFANLIRNIILFCHWCDKCASVRTSAQLLVVTEQLRGHCLTDGNMDVSKVLTAFAETVKAVNEVIDVHALPVDLFRLYIRYVTAIKEECAALQEHKGVNIPQLAKEMFSSILVKLIPKP